jgi:hypothetical protein
LTLVRVNVSDTGGESLLLNLQMVTRVECRNFDGEQDRHQAAVFTSDGGSVQLVGAEADKVVAALEDFAGYPRS